MSKLEQLQKQLQIAKDKLANAAPSIPLSMIEDEDTRQQQAKLQWYKSELSDDIASLENQIANYRPVMARTAYPTGYVRLAT